MFSKLREARDPHSRDKAVKIVVKEMLGHSPSFRLGSTCKGLNRMLGVCNPYCPPSTILGGV